MRKINIVLALIVGVMVLTGCNKTTVCNIKMDKDSYTIDSEYKITHDGTYVSKVSTVEKMESNDADIIEQFEELINNQLEPYKDLKYYDYKIEKKDNKLIEKITIDYTRIDIDKFIEINSGASNLFDNKKIKYDTMISMYKQLGATCN